jgi:large subunit ribosomal protein L19
MKTKLLQIVDDLNKATIKNLTAKQGEVQKSGIVREVPEFEIGDTVDVHQWIEIGEKGRTQIFSGVVIARRGEGPGELFTVRRVVQGEGVERVFPLYSPRISKIEVKRQSKVRRAKLFYLRDRVGKATRLKDRKDSKTGKVVKLNANANKL